MGKPGWMRAPATTCAGTYRPGAGPEDQTAYLHPYAAGSTNPDPCPGNPHPYAGAANVHTDAAGSNRYANAGAADTYAYAGT